MNILVIDQNAEGLTLQIRKGDSSSGVVSVPKDGVLEAISELAKSEELKISDLNAAVVRLQEGRFSATRIATVTANAFSFAEGRKVYSMLPGEDVSEALKREPKRYIAAQYSAAPSISKPKV